MAQVIKHAKTSAIPDGADAAQVQPSDWNANHQITGTVDYSELSGKPATFPATPATTTEVLAGTDAAKAVTPDALAALWELGPAVTAAATISLGEGGYFVVNGNTGISDIDFATDKAGRMAWLFFTGTPLLTHSSTLPLPTATNYQVEPGDKLLVVSESSDIVRVLDIVKADGTALVAPYLPLAGGTLTGALTINPATGAADFNLFRSQTPVTDDVIYSIDDSSPDGSGGTGVGTWSRILSRVRSATAGAVSHYWAFRHKRAGVDTDSLLIEEGLIVGSPAPTGGDKGLGTINAKVGYYVNGVGVVHGVAYQQFTANGTYTPNPKMLFCEVELWGAGGGGAGAGQNGTESGISGGGGSGGYSIAAFTAATIGASKAVVIGALGAGGAAGANNGSNGGQSTFGGSLLISGGGGGGTASGIAAVQVAQGGTGGAAGSNSSPIANSAFNGAGNPGGNGVKITSSTGRTPGFGAPSPNLGGGGRAIMSNAASTQADGGSATSRGAGGAGGLASTTVNAAGGDGAAGYCRIKEFLGP